MAKKVIVGGRIESKEVGGIVTGAAEILDDTKGKKQNVINQETDAELERLDGAKQNVLTFDNTPTEGSNNPVKSGGVYAADKALSDAIEAILLLIPGAASALNKLVDMAMMNSSISTATATFRGTYNVVTDLELAIDATHEQIAAKLGEVINTADNNDYAFVQVPVSAESTDIRRTERYKFNGTAWAYEYDLNTSGFTAAQWAAINSGITIALVAKLNGLPTSSELMALLGQKQDTLTFDNIPTSGSNNPVKSGGVYSAINDEKTAREQLAQSVAGINGRLGNVEEVIPSGAAANNKLVANNSMEAYVASIIDAITASFTIATADGHINLTLTQTNGRVASLTLTSSDIASAQALTALTGRVSMAEGNITSLGGRVSTNETDIANLQQLYNNLQQSKPVAVTALPETGQQQGVIYRLAGTTSYSDYMWNGSTWVLMATYNNAIDPRPKKASQNLVTSGGVFDNMGALDVSELNATENPHTLAQYVDLSAALAAIPTDYQKGGMSIKFVQSSDNNYVQYLYHGTSTVVADFTNIENWEKVNLEKEVNEIGSKVTFPVTITFTNDTTFKKLPFTIKAGSYLISTTPSSELGGPFFGKISESDASSFAIVANNVINNDLNYIRYNNYSGSITFIFNGLYNTIEETSKSLEALENNLKQKPEVLDGYIVSSTNKLKPYDATYSHYMISVKAGQKLTIARTAGADNLQYAILKSFNGHDNSAVEYATGCTLVDEAGSTVHQETIPSDGKYLYVRHDYTNPAAYIIIDGWDYLNDDIITSIVRNTNDCDSFKILSNVEVLPQSLTYDKTGYIDIAGVLHSSTGYWRLEPISVKRNDVVKIVNAKGSTSVAAISKVVADNTYLPLKIYEDGNQTTLYYQVKEDCNLCINTLKAVSGLISVTLYRALDNVAIKTLSNIINSKSVNQIMFKDNLFNPADAVNNMSLEGNSAYDTTQRWVTGFIPVDEDTNYLNCNYPISVNAQGTVCKISKYNVNKEYIGNVTSVRLPIEVKAFNDNTRYIRITFSKDILSFEDRYLLSLTKSNYSEPTPIPTSLFDGRYIGIKTPAYLSNRDIKDFEAIRVYGNYVSETEFRVDGSPVTLDETNIYIDKTLVNIGTEENPKEVPSKRTFRYDGSVLYEIGCYDDKSMIFTESFAISIPKNDISKENLIVTANAKYYQGNEITAKPTVRLVNYRQTVAGSQTIRYTIGGNKGFQCKEWRAQPLSYMEDRTTIQVTVPSGVTLFIDRFGNFYSDKKGYVTYPRVNAHSFGAPDNSMAYFEQCAKMGFNCMITIPKRTSDRIWVCFHDDDTIERYATNENGSEIQNSGPISDYTYEQLLSFDIGIKQFQNNISWMGQKIPLLKDFLMICAKTGVHPMFSIHPMFTAEQWAEVKAMTDALGLTSRLNLKVAWNSQNNPFDVLFEVFGNEVESYTADVSGDIAETFNTYWNSKQIDRSKVKVGVEFVSGITESAVANALSYGFFAAKVMDNDPTSEDYEYWMNQGVTEFTDDNHTSVGLNW